MTLSTMSPVVDTIGNCHPGAILDGMVSGEMWQWARSMDMGRDLHGHLTGLAMDTYSPTWPRTKATISAPR